MSTKTRFEIALESNEMPPFFKGHGIYFSYDREWGEHLYINNWQGLCGYLKSYDAPNPLLEKSFIEYLDTLEDRYEDADSLLLNIHCYYHMRVDTPFMSADGYDLINALSPAHQRTVGELFRRLRNEYAIQNADRPVITFDDFLNRLKKFGCTVDLERL